MEFKNDIPVEVTENQYYAAMSKCRGIVAGRIDESGKYFIKVWLSRYTEYVQQVLA